MKAEDLKDFAGSSPVSPLHPSVSLSLSLSPSVSLAPSTEHRVVKEPRSTDREKQEEEVVKKMVRGAGKRGRGGKE